ncbi:MAG: GEVED domain-containing protein, partial [Rudanella sp.]|nr:GEVED domain-containing protein [Rudanella sp.]
HCIGLLIALLHMVSVLSSYAQMRPSNARDSLFCKTPEPTPSEIRALESQIKLALAVKQASGIDKAGVTAYVPIRPHIFRRSNGTGGMTLNSLNNVLALTNKFYFDNGSGIQFYFCGTSPDYINNDALFLAFPSNDESSADSRDATNAMNVYLVNVFDDSRILGFANFPNNSVQSTRSFIRTGSLSDSYIGSYVLNHELGHNFNLYHTFQGNSPSNTPELVTRGSDANCTFAGDLICDTPADPFGRNGATSSIVNGCEVYTGTITDPNGQPYNPQMANIMSYYDGCNSLFTAGQFERIQGGLAARQNATAYTIDCPPTPVAPVSTLNATPGPSGGIVLTWQDNASNEMGYVIERSTSPTGLFGPIGGLGPDNTSFNDLNTSSFTTYSYRIRPSNSTTGGLSGVVTATSGATFCRPTFTRGCYEADGLDSFTINDTVMSQNTGCSSTAYNQYVSPVPTLVAGQTVPIGGRLLSTVYREGVTIWGDLNRNNTYEASEQLYQTPATLPTGFSGNLTIPVGTAAGSLKIRLIVQFGGNPTNPCGNYEYGEGEDYVVQVSSTCATLFTTRAGNWNDPTLWSCNRVPTATDSVEVRHVVTVPASTTVSARRVTYIAVGKVIIGAGGRLLLGL